MTIGIIGYGHNGTVTARKVSQGFGCRVLVTAPTLLKNYEPGHELAPAISVSDLKQIQHEADAIVLHLPLTPATRHFVDDEFLKNCRCRPLLINVSRGGLVDNEALLRALDAGLLSGAGLDVVEGEPTPPLACCSDPRS